MEETLHQLIGSLPPLFMSFIHQPTRLIDWDMSGKFVCLLSCWEVSRIKIDPTTVYPLRRLGFVGCWIITQNRHFQPLLSPSLPPISKALTSFLGNPSSKSPGRSGFCWGCGNFLANLLLQTSFSTIAASTGQRLPRSPSLENWPSPVYRWNTGAVPFMSIKSNIIIILRGELPKCHPTQKNMPYCGITNIHCPLSRPY